MPISVVTSEPWAIRFGSNTNSSRANNAGTAPNLSSAATNTRHAAARLSNAAAIRARNRIASALSEYRKFSPPSYSDILKNPAGGGAYCKCMPSSGTAASNFTSGGCSGFIPKSACFQ
jgi:hypothetical protein